MATIDILQPRVFEQTMFKPGEIQGNYSLEGLVAQRDYSEVYRGVNMATGQMVAVKFARDYQSDGPNPIALEALIHKKVSGQEGILPMDGADIFGLNGDLPHLATPFQERGTFSRVLKEEDEDAGESPRSVVLQRMQHRLEELVESHDGETPDPEILGLVSQVVAAQGVPAELASSESDPSVQDVVEAVVDAAEQRFGKDALDPNSVTAQVAALDTVRIAAEAEEMQHQIDVREEKEAPSRDEILRRLHILKGVASGYVALHAAGYIHRDGKPSNFYVDDNDNGMLGDFSAAVKDGYETHLDVGSPGYIAPEEGGAEYAELVNEEAGEGLPKERIEDIRYTSQGDMYRFMSVALESITGVRPYPVPKPGEKRVMLNPYKHDPRGLERLMAAPVERDVVHMVLRGMSTQMLDRPTAVQAAAVLDRY